MYLLYFIVFYSRTPVFSILGAEHATDLGEKPWLFYPQIADDGLKLLREGGWDAKYGGSVNKIQ